LIISETIFALLFGFIYDHRLPFASEWAAIAFLITGVLLAIHSGRLNAPTRHISAIFG
jgi:hypothetical protein